VKALQNVSNAHCLFRYFAGRIRIIAITVILTIKTGNEHSIYLKSGCWATCNIIIK
jgi:hypothetical protein